MDKRIFVEKKLRFRTEAEDILSQLRNNLGLDVISCRVISTYDIFNINENVLEKALRTIFSEPMVDEILDDLPSVNGITVSREYLPGQYDQRADSARQCVGLLNPETKCSISSGQTFLIEGEFTPEEEKRIRKYLINPIEAREKDMSVFSLDTDVRMTPVEDLSGFTSLSDDELSAFVKSHGMAMSFEDLKFIQEYFRNEEKRDPSETELRVLDTYWSDHCRHTTFETCLENIVINHDRFSEDIQNTYNEYLRMRAVCGRSDRPETLMDMATINARYLRKTGKHTDVERSEEINACSVFVDVDVDGKIEKWLMQFKNETHNHPTEIEPFGGASTCIGGAIRDPLSGRSYVYQAMRIAGCGNILEDISDTMPSKLPQRVLARTATRGNSSYGNQIGLPTTYAREIYHPGYVAKHLELGAVVGAVRASDVRRETLTPGDVIILLGGDTGRDGIGGATGSSKEHNDSSLTTCAAEVQKGNAPEERKIQRLFRNPEVTRMIKKCNDFGAGGVCVAIGELADGLVINLDEVKLKYAGLNPTEIAISESQERMAVGVDRSDAERFIGMARRENLKAYAVAEVTDSGRLVMMYRGNKVVDLSRAFINTSGVRQSVSAEISDRGGNGYYDHKEVTKENILTMLSDLNVACQKGMSEMFDASIGSTTVLMPWAGKEQLTPVQASVQKFPVQNGKTDSCSILACGFDPYTMEDSPYKGAMASVLSSISKTVAYGGKLENIHFSFQEYFKRLHRDPKRWGSVVEALLGAMKVSSYFEKGAIGGKDSMSGSFNDIDVPDTLVSFACSAADAKNIISPEMKSAGHRIGLYMPKLDDAGLFDLSSFKRMYASLEAEIGKKNIVSAYVLEAGGVAEALIKMCFGSRLGFEISCENALDVLPGAVVVEYTDDIDHDEFITLGSVTEKDFVINGIRIDHDEALSAWMSTVAAVYPVYGESEEKSVRTVNCSERVRERSLNPVDEVNVCIPAFPGTNCEYDIKRAFEDEGAKGNIVVFANHDEALINESIDNLVSELSRSQILALPGGFSSGDEPDGSAKFIINVLKNEKVHEAVMDLLARDGLILGICNGFQALIKSGLLPYGEIRDASGDDPTLFHNSIHRHISTMAHTRVSSVKSPWLSGFECGDDHMIAMSHGEGRFVCSPETLKTLMDNGQIAFQYCDPDLNATMDPRYNINNSDMAIEGIISPDGHILGKMGHSERYQEGLFIDIPGNKKQNIFRNGVEYFRK